MALTTETPKGWQPVSNYTTTFDDVSYTSVFWVPSMITKVLTESTRTVVHARDTKSTAIDTVIGIEGTDTTTASESTRTITETSTHIIFPTSAGIESLRTTTFRPSVMETTSTTGKSTKECDGCHLANKT